jgi:hypothetical protein
MSSSRDSDHNYDSDSGSDCDESMEFNPATFMGNFLGMAKFLANNGEKETVMNGLNKITGSSSLDTTKAHPLGCRCAKTDKVLPWGNPVTKTKTETTATTSSSTQEFDADE